MRTIALTDARARLTALARDIIQTDVTPRSPCRLAEKD